MTPNLVFTGISDVGLLVYTDGTKVEYPRPWKPVNHHLPDLYGRSRLARLVPARFIVIQVRCLAKMSLHMAQFTLVPSRSHLGLVFFRWPCAGDNLPVQFSTSWKMAHGTVAC